MVPASRHSASWCWRREVSVPLLPLQIQTAPLKKRNNSDAFSLYVITYPPATFSPVQSRRYPEDFMLEHREDLPPRHSLLSQDLLCCQFTMHCWYQRTLKTKQIIPLCSNLSMFILLNYTGTRNRNGTSKWNHKRHRGLKWARIFLHHTCETMLHSLPHTKAAQLPEGTLFYTS